MGIFLTYETPQYPIRSYAQEGNKFIRDFRLELKTEKTDYQLLALDDVKAFLC